MYLPSLKGSQPLIGWRGWDVKRPGVICSPKDVWLPLMRMESECNRRAEDHKPPMIQCTCGIYAFKLPEQIRQQKYDHQAIFGELWLWGRIVEHEEGYRAQYAYPKCFWIKPFIDPAPFTQMAYRYNVPLCIMPEDHPILMPSVQERIAAAEADRKEREAKLAAKLEKAAATRAARCMMENAAAKQPATKPGFKNLLDQIEWEVKQEVARQQQRR